MTDNPSLDLATKTGFLVFDADKEPKKIYDLWVYWAKSENKLAITVVRTEVSSTIYIDHIPWEFTNEAKTEIRNLVKPHCMFYSFTKYRSRFARIEHVTKHLDQLLAFRITEILLNHQPEETVC